MPGPLQHRTPYWYRHSYHQPNSLQFFAPNDFVPQQQQPPRTLVKDAPSARFIRQKSSRERARPSSISDLQYSLDSSPTSSVPSKSSVSSADTSPSVRTDSQSSSDITNLDQSCSSLPSQSGGSSGSSQEQATHFIAIPLLGSGSFYLTHILL